MSSKLTRYRVTTTPEAKEDLRELHEYIKLHSSLDVANRYLASLKQFAAELAYAPVRGRSIEHVRPGMRILGFKHRVGIVFAVFPDQQVVEIQGFDYAGRQRSLSKKAEAAGD